LPGKQPNNKSFERLLGSHLGALFHRSKRPRVLCSYAQRSSGPTDPVRGIDLFDARSDFHAAGDPAKLCTFRDLALKVHFLNALIPCGPFFEIG